MKISQMNFVDLYLGEDYCDFTGLNGAGRREPAPLSLQEEIGSLREQCLQILRAEDEEEFSLVVDGTMFRVTAIRDVLNQDVFILRRSSASIRPLDSIGFHPYILNELMSADNRGLILIAGEMGVGKTSTAASVLKARLEKHGGIAVAIEDPPETNLNGLHGEGRCIQIRASRKNGGYQEQMRRAMRSGADTILVGEIRDDEPALEAIRGSINGHLLISTIHAAGPIEALERLQTFCKAKAPNTNEILADGLSLIIWQALERVPLSSAPGNNKYVTRLQSKFLFVRGKNSARSKIREGRFDQLVHDMHEQANQASWGNSGAKHENI